MSSLASKPFWSPFRHLAESHLPSFNVILCSPTAIFLPVPSFHSLLCWPSLNPVNSLRCFKLLLKTHQYRRAFSQITMLLLYLIHRRICLSCGFMTRFIALHHSFMFCLYFISLLLRSFSGQRDINSCGAAGLYWNWLQQFRSSN